MVQRHLGEIHPGPDRGVKQGGLAVLSTAYMPAVLVETGFVTNPQDAKLITDKSYQAEMANSIAAGIVRYVRLFEKTKGFTE